MINNNQLIVFVVSFMIAGLFILYIPQEALTGSDPGPPPCCDVPDQNSCFSGVDQESCEVGFGGVFFVDRPCVGEEGGNAACEPPPTAIPTLSQWGKIITIAVIGLFAVKGLIIMRRRNAVSS